MEDRPREVGVRGLELRVVIGGEGGMRWGG